MSLAWIWEFVALGHAGYVCLDVRSRGLEAQIRIRCLKAIK